MRPHKCCGDYSTISEQVQTVFNDGDVRPNQCWITTFLVMILLSSVRVRMYMLDGK